jgi:hypothetical protein
MSFSRYDRYNHLALDHVGRASLYPKPLPF